MFLDFLKMYWFKILVYNFWAEGLTVLASGELKTIVNCNADLSGKNLLVDNLLC